VAPVRRNWRLLAWANQAGTGPPRRLALVEEVIDSVDEPLEDIESEERLVARFRTDSECVVKLGREEVLPTLRGLSHRDQGKEPPRTIRIGFDGRRAFHLRTSAQSSALGQATSEGRSGMARVLGCTGTVRAKFSLVTRDVSQRPFPDPCMKSVGLSVRWREVGANAVRRQGSSHGCDDRLHARLRVRCRPWRRPMTAEDSHAPSVLVAGKRFHRDVQAGYVAGLVGVELSDAAERTFVRVSGRKGASRHPADRRK
jgi:hypothetical protein